jgi:hypothetical protein
MQLRTFAEIATILGLGIAFLSYMKIEPNALDKIPGIYQKQATDDLKKTDLKIDASEYSGKNAYLLHQYRAAISMKSSYNRDQALAKVIDAAIKASDFKIAILCGKEISSSYQKSSELEKIVDAALKQEKHAGYAVIAAELIPSSYSKDAALNKIISFYEHGSAESKAPQELTELDKYKEIFTFADSTANMDMSEEEAKAFADKWIKERRYEDFQYFKKIYTFADSTASMDMSEKKAMKFALDWIDNYPEKEFEIFTSAFNFADSTAGMSMSAKDAEAFAFKKVEEYRISAKKASKLKATMPHKPDGRVE